MSAERTEALAAYAHRAWSGWMAYLFSKSTQSDDGSVTIPPELVKRWQRQLATPYLSLPEAEKESDRIEARAIVEVIERIPEAFPTLNEMWQTLVDETHRIEVVALKVPGVVTMVVTWNYRNGGRRLQTHEESLHTAITCAYQRHQVRTKQ